MSTGGKLVITVGIASSALLAAWLLTGNRKEKTKVFVAKRAEVFKDVLRKDVFRNDLLKKDVLRFEKSFGTEDQEIYYV